MKQDRKEKYLQTSVGTTPSVSLEPSTGPFEPEWLKKWDKKHQKKNEANKR